MVNRLLIVFCCLLITLGSFANGQTFDEFLSNVRGGPDSLTRSQIITEYLAHHSIPIVEDSLVHFLYRGNGTIVAVPGEVNGWNPSSGAMARITGTDCFIRTDVLPVDGRAEYKLWVDSAWILDPLNSQKALGGYGENSDVRMAGYVPLEIAFDSSIQHGKIDTLWFGSKILGRKHPVFVYSSPGVKAAKPVRLLYVTDGGEYLSLGKMHLILDDLTAHKNIQPLIAVFVDPRTDLRDASTNKRMTDYSASEAYLDFLEKELTPFINQKYPVSSKPDDRFILGASMGGLISTYTVLTRPKFIANCLAQSPAYRQADSAIIHLTEKMQHTSARVYMQTGTIHDTENEARYVHELLKRKGADIMYEEIHEGHNWTNWRTHLTKMLKHFFSKR